MYLHLNKKTQNQSNVENLALVERAHHVARIAWNAHNAIIELLAQVMTRHINFVKVIMSVPKIIMQLFLRRGWLITKSNF